MRVSLSLSRETLAVLDEFCNTVGATRSDVIDILINEYLDDLSEEMAKLSERSEGQEEPERWEGLEGSEGVEEPEEPEGLTNRIFF